MVLQVYTKIQPTMEHPTPSTTSASSPSCSPPPPPSTCPPPPTWTRTSWEGCWRYKLRCFPSYSSSSKISAVWLFAVLQTIIHSFASSLLNLSFQDIYNMRLIIVLWLWSTKGKSYPFTFYSKNMSSFSPSRRRRREPLPIQRFCLGRFETCHSSFSSFGSDVGRIQMPQDNIGNDCNSHFFETTPHNAGKEATFEARK